ncbi:hypothetical protein KJK32_40735 [Streptomyces sp. JCM17656]|nr:hypothetical protein KJK32_40735 [Streptomyces sp. JCM17656]
MDLAEATVAGSVRLDRCHFDETPRLDNANIDAAFELRDCTMPGLSLAGARIAHECEINACTVNGTVDLRSLTVGNRLSVTGTALHPRDGEAALDAQSVEVGEDFGHRTWTAPAPCT